MLDTLTTVTLAAPMADLTTDAEILAAWENGGMAWDDSDTLVWHDACACSATSPCLAHLTDAWRY